MNFHVVVPVVSGSDSASVSAAPDDGNVGTVEVLAAELANVQFAATATHIGVSGVADMAIMRPHDSFRVLRLGTEEPFQGLEHVRVPQVPRFDEALVHGLLVLLCIGNQACILFGAMPKIEVKMGRLRRGTSGSMIIIPPEKMRADPRPAMARPIGIEMELRAAP